MIVPIIMEFLDINFINYSKKQKAVFALETPFCFKIVFNMKKNLT